MAISGLIISFNEERHITACIKSLFRVCDEVIVIDSHSEDDTVKIAKSLNAKVYLNTFLGDGPQRIYGLQFCKNDWILNLDADERLDEDTFEFLNTEAYLNKSFDAYQLKMRNFLGEKEIKFAGWYPDYTCRFFNKRTANPSQSKVHQRILANNMTKTDLHLYHYGWSSFYQMIDKKNSYTEIQSRQLLEEKRHINILLPFIHGMTSFLRCYFLKKGILNGLDGFTFSIIQAFFSYMKYAKARKLKKFG